MNNVFAAKLLSQLQAKKKEGGFTLIELLVVVIIIGILSSIALPQFLNQAARARQVEGETIVGAINRAQQTFRLQSPVFGTLDQLVQTGNISFTVAGAGAGIPGTGATVTGDYFDFVVPVAPNGIDATVDAIPQGAFAGDLRSYQGAVFQNAVDGAFNSVICRSTETAAATAVGNEPAADADPAVALTTPPTDCTNSTPLS